MTDSWTWPIFLFIFFFIGAMLRGQAIYWLARYFTGRAADANTASAGWRKRFSTWISSSRTERGMSLIRRWGLPVIPLGYLTVGIQSLIFIGAGILRVPALTFTLVQIPGALAWALIYTTIGFAMWNATIAALAGSPAGLLTLAAIIIAIAAIVTIRRRRRSEAKADALNIGPDDITPEDFTAENGTTEPAMNQDEVADTTTDDIGLETDQSGRG